VNGDVTATHADGVGAWADFGGHIIVNGSISAVNYIIAYRLLFAPEDHAETSSLPGYLEYTDGTDFVWVLIPVDPNDVVGGDGSSALPSAGDAAPLALALLFSLMALGVTSLVMSRKHHGKEAL